MLPLLLRILSKPNHPHRLLPHRYRYDRAVRSFPPTPLLVRNTPFIPVQLSQYQIFPNETTVSVLQGFPPHTRFQKSRQFPQLPVKPPLWWWLREMSLMISFISLLSPTTPPQPRLAANLPRPLSRSTFRTKSLTLDPSLALQESGFELGLRFPVPKWRFSKFEPDGSTTTSWTSSSNASR